jgi:hypothetical protein
MNANLRRVFAGAAICVLAAAGCGSVEEGTPTGDRQDKPSTAEAATAADGTDLAACADGNCEVEVSGPVDIRLTEQRGGVTGLSIVEVGDGGVDFTTTSSGGGSGSGRLEPNCTLTFYEGGGGSTCSSGEAPPAQPETGVLAIQLASVTDDAVVLRIVAGKPGEPPARYPQAPSIQVPNVEVPRIPG